LKLRPSPNVTPLLTINMTHLQYKVPRLLQPMRLE
jgi:hypothetical protein